MRKILSLIFLFCLLNFSYEITNLKYIKNVSVNLNDNFKEHTIKNNDNYIIRYDFSIEDNNNVKVEPNFLILEPNEEKNFKVYITPEKDFKEKTYYLIIKEKVLNKDNNKNSLNINLTSRILQKYTIK